jgi:hypothetical protein
MGHERRDRSRSFDPHYGECHLFDRSCFHNHHLISRMVTNLSCRTLLRQEDFDWRVVTLTGRTASTPSSCIVSTTENAITCSRAMPLTPWSGYLPVAGRDRLPVSPSAISLGIVHTSITIGLKQGSDGMSPCPTISIPWMLGSFLFQSHCSISHDACIVRRAKSRCSSQHRIFTVRRKNSPEIGRKER